MTPFQIEILMHYATRADEWRNGDHSAPICADTFAHFLSEGLLEQVGYTGVVDDRPSTPKYRATERCRVYVEALQAVPLPVSVWVMPEQPNTKQPEQNPIMAPDAAQWEKIAARLGITWGSWGSEATTTARTGLALDGLDWER